MTLNLSIPHRDDLTPRITVFGVGGAGGNAVNNMIEKQLDGVDFVVANTDAQALAQTMSDQRIQLGAEVTEGLGAGARAEVGAAAAEESIDQIVDHLTGAHMCFITAGMGGGTGTGAAPIIAQAARKLGVLTVGVVTKPFQFEGAKRMRQAEAGVEALQQVVDTLIIIPNQNLFRLATEKTGFTEAFSLADDVLYQGVKGVTDLMVRPGLINLDFADVRAVMDEMGKAMMGTGEADGDNRAIQAAEAAIANPLLDEISLKGAKGVLINVTGSHDMTLFELDEAANRIREEVDPDANIIVGSTLDPDMSGRIRLSVVATGIDAAPRDETIPQPRRSMAAPMRFTSEATEPQSGVAPQSEGKPAAEVETAFVDAPAAAPVQPAPVPATPVSAAPLSAAPVAPAPAPQQQHQQQVNMFSAPDAQAYNAPADEVPAPVYRPLPRVQDAPTPSADTLVPNHEVPDHAIGLGPSEFGSGGGQAAQPEPQREKRRFGLNALIDRMAGQASDQPSKPVARPRTAAPDPAPITRQRPLHSQFDADPEANEDRIEIPAFLRRQAN
jgi:cell division protein FtsZ